MQTIVQPAAAPLNAAQVDLYFKVMTLLAEPKVQRYDKHIEPSLVAIFIASCNLELAKSRHS
jgi:hypothetical protein